MIIADLRHSGDGTLTHVSLSARAVTWLEDAVTRSDGAMPCLVTSPVHGYHKFVEKGFEPVTRISSVGRGSYSVPTRVCLSTPDPSPSLVACRRCGGQSLSPGWSMGKKRAAVAADAGPLAWWTKSNHLYRIPPYTATSQASPRTHSWLRGFSNGMIFVRESW